MARSPRQETVIVPAAGVEVRKQISGRWLTILSNTIASVDVKFDNDAYTPMTTGIPYPATDGVYERVSFRDPTGVGCTLEVIFSDQQTPDTRGKDDLAASGSHANIALAVVAKDGVGDTSIVTASEMNREIEINADPGNANYVYLSHSNPATSANAFTCLMPGGSWSDRTKEAIRACSTNGTEQVRGVIRRP